MQSHEGWETVAMNQRVRALQRDILINDRARLAEDFSTPEERVQAAEGGRAWEACMTLNGASWGYMPSAASDSKSARDILKMLNTACEGTGNLLLNIGPAPDGSVPPEAIEPLKTVGKWLQANGRAVYGTIDPAPGWSSACGGFSRKGNDVFFWCRYWPGRELVLGGFKTRLRSARFLAGCKRIEFEQQGRRILLRDMPARSPDGITGVTVIHLEFAGPVRHEPHPDTPVLRA